MKIENRCVSCGFCENYISCVGVGACIGCGACVDACPNKAKTLQESYEKRKTVRIRVNGEVFDMPERISILKALEFAGFRVLRFPEGQGILAPCRTGGCWACSVLVDGELKPSCITPIQAAQTMTSMRKICNVDRMAISGGECTLNRRWLIEYLKQLKMLNRDENARLHVDTNAVILTEDYIDELVEAGITDIGPDVKGLNPETFRRITGIGDTALAEKLLKTEWNAIKYLLENYWGEIFIGIGIPYNPKLISIQEIWEIGSRIASWEPDVQVCVLDYRPEFRRQDLERPSYKEMVPVKRILEEAGLRCVICQTIHGHIGPEKL